MNKSKSFFLLFLLIISTSLPIPPIMPATASSVPRTGMQRLEEQLAVTTGMRRAELLEKLSILLKDTESEQAWRYGAEALQLREKNASLTIKAAFCNHMGELGIRLGHFREAENYCARAITLAKQSGDVRAQANALNIRGRANKYIPNYALALESLNAAREFYRKLGDQTNYANSLNNLGLVYRRLCNYSKSLAHLLDAMVIYSRLDNKNGISSVANNIGLIHQALNRYDEALTYFKISRKNSEEIADEAGASIAWSNIAHVYDLQGNYKEALALYNKTLAVKKKFKDPLGMSTILLKIGQHHHARKNYPLALDYLNRALRMKEGIHETFGIANVLLEIGSMLHAQGRDDEAKSFLRRALDMAEEISATTFVRDSARELAHLFENREQYQPALLFHKKYKDAEQKLALDSNSQQILRLQTHYEMELKEGEIILLKKDKKIRDLELKRSNYLRNFLLIITGLTFVLGIISFLGYRLKTRINRTLKESEHNFRSLLEKRTKELEAAQVELVLKERLSVLGQLTATVAHEIRTPLSAVRNSVFAIGSAMEHGRRDRVQRALELAERNIVRCDNIIAELLDLTRRRELKPEKTDLREWLGAVTDEYLFPSSIVIEKDFQSTAPVNIDRERFSRAVNNVLQNSVRALLHKDGADKRITVASRQEKHHVEIVISDNGPGIAPELMPHIFEPLFTTRSFGFGLGLTVVKNIMAEHGGGVEIHSEKGMGAQAVLRLPQ